MKRSLRAPKPVNHQPTRLPSRHVKFQSEYHLQPVLPTHPPIKKILSPIEQNGLNYLTEIEELYIHRQYHELETIAGMRNVINYRIVNSQDEQIYHAMEELNYYDTSCFGKSSSLTIHVLNNFGTEVLKGTKREKCAVSPCCRKCDCLGRCGAELDVEAPVGETYAYVTEVHCFGTPSFVVSDADKQPVLKISNNSCRCGSSCPSYNEFQIYDLNKSEIGSLTRRDIEDEHPLHKCVDFYLSFPKELDMRMKAVLLCTILVRRFLKIDDDDSDV